MNWRRGGCVESGRERGCGVPRLPFTTAGLAPHGAATAPPPMCDTMCGAMCDVRGLHCSIKSGVRARTQGAVAACCAPVPPFLTGKPTTQPPPNHPSTTPSPPPNHRRPATPWSCGSASPHCPRRTPPSPRTSLPPTTQPTCPPPTTHRRRRRPPPPPPPPAASPPALRPCACARCRWCTERRLSREVWTTQRSGHLVEG
jgi:hypothetical protein